MSKLIVEAVNENDDGFKLIFLSDIRDGEPEFQFDLLDKNDNPIFSDQISISNDEARVLISFLTSVLNNKPF
jgi:hypothetical protein